MPQGIIAATGIACGAVAMLAQANAHPSDSIPQYAQLGGTGGLIVCLIIAVRHVSAQRDTKEQKIVQLLETAVASNTTALQRFEKEARDAKDVAEQQSEKICSLLQEILYEFRDGTERTDKHDRHTKKSQQ